MDYGKLADGAIKYAKKFVIINGTVIERPTAAQYLAADDGPWKYLDFSQPSEPAPTGYHYEQDGYEETVTEIMRRWKTVEDPTIYRKFSKLKIYGAISQLGAWNAIQTWLEAKTINGMNGWLAFQLAQEISEDHAMFTALVEEARQLLGLTTEQFETLLASCILEG